ncbi:MAG: hypothetical protein KGO96_10105 [Elusimicrobia bacterium]|nr:hypothetical protein [Elusimicrobiota bacterium]
MTKPVISAAKRKCANPTCRVEFWPRHGRQTYHAEWCRILAHHARLSSQVVVVKKEVASALDKTSLQEAYARGVAAGREEHAGTVLGLDQTIRELRDNLSKRLDGDAEALALLAEERSRSDALTASLVEVRQVRDRLHREVAALKKDVVVLQESVNDERRLRISADDRSVELEHALRCIREDLARARTVKSSPTSAAPAPGQFSMLGSSLTRRPALRRDQVVAVEVTSSSPSSMADNSTW